MMKHYGSAVPIALAEPVLTVFRNAPGGLHVTTPVWSDKADDRHLIFELCLSGITPGLYAGRTVRSVDLTRQARIRDLMAGGMSQAQAVKASALEARENEADWRSETNRRLSMEDRADIIRRWSYKLLEQQIILKQKADDAFPSGIPDLEIEDSLVEVGHVLVDRWTAVRLSDHPRGLTGALQEEVRHVLQSPAASCGYESAILRRSTEEGMRTTKMTTVDTGPYLQVQRNVIEEDGILVTFDGTDICIYGLKDERADGFSPQPGETLSKSIDLSDAELSQRVVKSHRRARPGRGGPDLVITVETDIIAARDLAEDQRHQG